ncbi:hypothetical protein [Allomuricauda sp. F6463D]|uniref:hypothetical protein n=1 Tax=Allomuricauda sp. F6463D TaxID=2926409 RepID=UPI001FF5AEC9|nr:hypothetical protein [Muricauda sp. F6463D]MCK0159363.1 hypothetical protein [Muricauda sp. F6463D]
MNKFQIALLFSFFILPFNSHAQFFKKLKEKAENAIERTILNKTDEEVSKGTDETIDGIIKNDKKPPTETRESGSTTSETNNTTEVTKDGLPVIKLGQDEVEVDAAEAFANTVGDDTVASLSSTYTFSYKVIYTINNGKGNIQKVMYYEPNNAYFGTSIHDDDVYHMQLTDPNKQASFLFVGDSIKTALPIAKDHILHTENINSIPGSNSNNGVTVEKLDYKKMKDLLCRGYRITTPEGVVVVYIAERAPVQYKGGLSQTAYIPNSLFKGENYMIMELAFQSNDPDEKPIHVRCFSIQEQKKTLTPSNYKQFGSSL